MVSHSDHKQRAVFQRFSRHLKVGASLGALIVALAACSFGGSATGAQVSSGNQTGTATATATSAPTATTAAATATHAPAPTATHAAAPTPTPVPPLQSQIIIHAFNNIAGNSHSPIADMTCPSGYLVAGGGPNSGATNFVMMWNAPINTTTWRAEVFNNDTNLTHAPISVQVQVVCLKVAGLQSQIISKMLGGIVDLTCPSGYLVTGGGPNAGYSDFTMMWSAPINTTTWQAEASGPHAAYVQEQVVCLKVSGLKSQIILHALNNIAAGANSPIVTMTCPSGYLVAGGGPNSGYSNFTMMQGAPISTTTWRAEVFNNNTSGTVNVQEQVVCLKH